MWVDRRQAGEQLAGALEEYRGRNAIVLGIPRGGVVVAKEVAAHLGCPLDIVVPRKIGAPFNPELAIGAIAADGSRVLDHELIERLGVSAEYLQQETKNQQAEIARRMKQYRGGRPPLKIAGKTIIVVDDGVATGATTRAALVYLKKQRPGQLVLAVPVGPKDTLGRLAADVDRLVFLSAPEVFYAVGQFYERFEQTTDQEVVALLALEGSAGL